MNDLESGFEDRNVWSKWMKYQRPCLSDWVKVVPHLLNQLKGVSCQKYDGFQESMKGSECHFPQA